MAPNFILNKSFVLVNNIGPGDTIEPNLGVRASLFDTNATPPKGGILTKNLYASLDPYQLGKMRGHSGLRCYGRPYKIGETIDNFAIAEVIGSDSPKFKCGDFITGILPIEEYSQISYVTVDTLLSRLEDTSGFSLDIFLGPLGIPGLAAHASFYNIGRPTSGETIFISTAAGAVGQVVGQLAKFDGLKVIGSVGSAEKLRFLMDELKFDGGFNYHEESAKDALMRLAPEGIDIYFDNVGGEQLEAALSAMKRKGRIVGCGMMSTYADPDNEPGVRGLMNVIMKALTFQGFDVIADFTGTDHVLAHQQCVRQHLREDSAPKGYASIYAGENFGKVILKIADPS
ncbi:putative reductase RED1 [Aspergillus udagawae]|nr:putative reductase RED1 [Aspergillus udagawae]